MSLLTVVNQGGAGEDYFVKNISTSPAYPVIAAANGDVAIQTDGGIAALTANGGAGNVLKLGANQFTFQNIVLEDSATTINTDAVMEANVGISGDLDVFHGDVVLQAGNLNFAGGGSISGYYSSGVAVTGSGPVANPAGLTAGLYAVFLNPTNDADRLASPSSVFYWSGTQWIMGNAVSTAFTAGAPNCVVNAAAGLATLEVTGTGVPAGTLVFSKLAN